ncbi:hypothetical protein [Streptomyces sp. NPDC051776]|uniref:hypothetical protein n=1 Tax=Streptomyces sp. NPDC051776 TaxID=3155414 RepID=UPI003437F644
MGPAVLELPAEDLTEGGITDDQRGGLPLTTAGRNDRQAVIDQHQLVRESDSGPYLDTRCGQ